MKRIWQVIEREMRTQNLTAREMAGKLRMDPAQLSRLRGGRLRDLSSEALGHLLTRLHDSPDVRAELLAAYLSDKLGSRVVNARLARKVAGSLRVAEGAADSSGGDAPTIPDLCERAGLNSRVARALGTLAEEATGNRRLQELLVSLANYASSEIPD